MNWADEFRGKFGVRANADIPRDAKAAREFGAEGIGLCRTEHMFFAADRIPHMQAMILAEDEKTRKKALQKLLPMQRKDFAGLFEAMDGYPVIIRTLDPPLHEFLPKRENLMVDLARLPHAGGKEKKQMSESYGIPVGDLKKKLPVLLKRVEDLHEFNPMLGFRGCRLGIVHTEITEMQARAIFEAAVQVAKKGIKVIPEVMIPLVGFQRELALQKEIVERVAKEVLDKAGMKNLKYLIGTMIEIPRGAVTADQIAEVAAVLQLRHQRSDADHARHVARRLHEVLEEIRRAEDLQGRSVPDHRSGRRRQADRAGGEAGPQDQTTISKSASAANTAAIRARWSSATASAWTTFRARPTACRSQDWRRRKRPSAAAISRNRCGRRKTLAADERDERVLSYPRLSASIRG